MKRTLKTNFITNSYDLNRLFECNRTSAEVWNDCVKISKSYHKDCGKWIGKTELQKRTKGQYAIHSQSIQAVCHKYLWARDSAKAARDQGYDNKYPYREKRNFNTKWAKDGFTIYENGKIELSLGIHNRKRQKPITVWIKGMPVGKVKEIELIYDEKKRNLMLCLSYEDGQLPKENHHTRVAAIDLGEIHSIAAVAENSQGIIITGRKIRSIKRLRNKKIAELQKKMSKCKEGSKQWKRYYRAKRYIIAKSEDQLKDALHKTTKNFVDWCIEQEIKEVVVGKVEGVQRNTSARKKNNKKKRSRKVNQKLSQWQFGLLMAYLIYKCEAEGIKVHEINEAYTSQTCPVCTRRKKVSGRVYSCSCGYKCHRDLHGSSNILSKYLHNGEIKPVVKEIQSKYLRVA